ncbi:hypothetical protein GGTG_05963 [Gaeumannomyces tritici R3-111a-1]|uniref:Uncharacterized protein n=1 Tax=Gaeumannomyces tritici (strain R3-111a-1) TaxID=644352 RepID=J3NXF7_GAET3|nr:hypothetical protein GGTG_05963 [Gaeumannomyces tritici R3-111a-1]EJT76039.1 hypothetical protein GGTG_05963 [Gaeumannomyces tritici R3-111a-1]
MPSLPPSLPPSAPSAPSTPGKMGLPGRPRNKPTIMDPPGAKMDGLPGRFPSPTVDHATLNPKFDDDLARLTFAMHQSLPQAVRRAVRDNWEKCLIGSESHVAFLLNATLHNATSSTLKRAIRDFGSKLVKSSMTDLLEHLSQADIDSVSDIILAKASHEFLDKALEKRLRTIEAKPLINALCRAERLGYEADDAEDDENSSQPAGTPVQPPNFMPGHPVGPPQTPSTPAPRQEASWNCNLCYRHFTVQSAYEYHTSKTVCTRVPPNPGGFKQCCRYCGQGFTTAVGLQYHFNNKVCGDFGPTPAHQNMPKGYAAGVAASSPQVPSPTPHMPSSAHQAKYAPMTSTPPSSGTPNLLGRTVSGADPYAHLTDHQRLSLNEELRQAEVQFAERFKQADAIVDHNERRTKLDGLRNSFGTKQSIIRKKYGVKLRERRTRAEIEAERQRMGITNEMDGNAPSPSHRPGAPTITPVPLTQQNGIPAMANGNRFSSVNVPIKREMPDDGLGAAAREAFKRPRIDDDGSNTAMASPNVPSTQVSSIQASSAQSALTQQHQAGAPIEISSSAGTTSRGASAASDLSGTPDLAAQIDAETETYTACSLPPPPEPSGSIPENSTAQVGGDEDEDGTEDGDDDDDDNDDIPAELPSNVRQSLASSNRMG